MVCLATQLSCFKASFQIAHRSFHGSHTRVAQVGILLDYIRYMGELVYIDLIDRYTYFGFLDELLVYDMEEFVEIPIKFVGETVRFV